MLRRLSKMSLLKSSSMFDAMFPVLSLGSIMGITPFKLMIKPGQSKMLLSIPYSILNILHLFIFFYCYIYVIVFETISFIYNNAPLFKYTEMSQIYIGFLTMTAIHVLKFFNRDNLANHFEFAETLREIFHNLGTKRIYTHLKLKLYIAVVLQFALCAFLLGLNIMGAARLRPHERFPVLVVVVWPTCVIAMAQFITSSFIYCTKTNLLTLNGEICKIQSKPHGIPAVPTTSIQLYPKTKISLPLQTMKHDVLEKLDLIWKAYVRICEMSNNLNDYFYWMILAILVLSFINTLFNVFYFLCILAYANKRFLHMYEIYCIRLAKCLVNAVNMYFLSVMCNVCETEVSFIIFFK